MTKTWSAIMKKWTREEDKVLKQYAGVYTAEKIGAMLERPKHGVHHRMAKLGLKGRLSGERHWNARLSDITAEMIGVLHDGGFTVNEIHRVLTNPPGISLQTVSDIAGGRTRRQS